MKLVLPDAIASRQAQAKAAVRYRIIEPLRPGVDALRQVLALARVTSVSILGALVAAAALIFLPQTHESLRVIAEDDNGLRRVAHLGLNIGVGALLATTVWLAARTMLQIGEPAASIDRRAPTRLADRYLPIACGAIVMLSLVVSFVKAAMLSGNLRGGERELLLLAAVLTVLGGVALCYKAIRQPDLETLVHPFDAMRTAKSAFADQPAFTRRIFWLLIGLSLALFISVLWTSGISTIGLGATATLLVGITTWILVGTMLVYWGVRSEFPVFRSVLCAVLLFAALDCGDNHGIRTLPNSLITPVSLDTHVDGWLRSRSDAADYPEAYPVFIVAAEGGGIRNSYLTATVLSALHDACPRFTHHLLAMSAVSGGSVGAAVIAGLLADGGVRPDTTCALPDPSNPGALQRRVENILSRDLLTPVIASGLYLETVHKVLAFPGMGRFDRARALERAIERAYAKDPAIEKHGGATVMERAFDSLAIHTHVPLLFFNTTDVDAGTRMVVASAQPLSGRFHPVTLADVSPGLSVRLSTAAAMSARFPFVTPEAVVNHAGRTSRFVDGGYFDNSGVTTAIDIASALLLHQRADSLKALAGASPGPRRIRPIIVHIAVSAAARDSEAVARKGMMKLGFHELMAPVRTMLNTRGARGSVIVKQFAEQARLRDTVMSIVELDAQEGTVPYVLGWQMSGAARMAMTASLMPAPNCDSRNTDSKNDCDFGRVLALLRPRQ